MFETILVRVGETQAQSFIIQQVACIAKKMQAQVLLYYAFPSMKNASGFVDPLNWSLKKSEAESALDYISEELKQLGIRAEGVVVENESAATFIEYAYKQDVSLIITEKPSNGISDLFQELIKSSRIPILSIPKLAMKDCFNRILVPLDGSKRAECALPFVSFLSETLGSEVILAHVVQPPSFARINSIEDEQVSSLSKKFVESTRQDAMAYLKQISSRFSVPIYAQVIVNTNIASSLHKIIEDESIDLVIMSAHGNGGNPQWPYGSISNNLVAYGLAPLLLIQDLPISQDFQETITVQHRYINQS